MNALSHAGASALDLAIRRKDHTRADGVAHHVLADFRLTLPVGAVGALVGPSGCGKTTLLRLVAGLDQNYDGEIHLPAHGRLGMVFQEPRLLPWRTVAENLDLAVPEGTDPGFVQGLLDQVGLADVQHQYPGQLSLGMSRRVALVRAFAIAPDLLLMDEPLVSLDTPAARKIRELMLQLWQGRPHTVLYVTHDMREAIALADRLVFLSPGPCRISAEVVIPIARHERSPDRIEAFYRSLQEDVIELQGLL